MRTDFARCHSRIRFGWPHAALLGVVLFAHTNGAWAQSAPSARATLGAPIARRFAPDSLWRRVWALTSDSTSDAFVEPRQVVVSGDLVVVLDAGTREVRGVDARTGAARFVLTARGQGPGEFKRPSMIAATPTGFAVLDQANARLTAFDRRGARVWDAVLDNIFEIDGLCVRSGSRVIVTLKRRDSSIVEYDSTGRRSTVRSFPWTARTPEARGFAHSAFTSDASLGGECVVAPMFGAEWGVVTSTGATPVFALHEPGVPAVITKSERVLQRTLTRVLVEGTQTSETKAASRGALVRGDTAIVYAAHTRRHPLLLLDYYSTRSGGYLFSRRLPFAFNALTIGPDGTLYGTRLSPDVQAVIAMRPERPAPTPRKKP